MTGLGRCVSGATGRTGSGGESVQAARYRVLELLREEQRGMQ